MEKKLKVLMLNGSPRKDGNIALAFSEMEKIFAENMASLLRNAAPDIEIIESEMDEDPFVGGLI